MNSLLNHTVRGRTRWLFYGRLRLGFWDDFAPAFTRPTFRRFLTLLGAAILTVGRRTIANLLRTAGSLAVGASSGYRRVFSKARWSPLRLACALARRVVALLPADAEIVLVGDDTVFSHPGRGVPGFASWDGRQRRTFREEGGPSRDRAARFTSNWRRSAAAPRSC